MGARTPTLGHGRSDTGARAPTLGHRHGRPGIVRLTNPRPPIRLGTLQEQSRTTLSSTFGQVSSKNKAEPIYHLVKYFSKGTRPNHQVSPMYPSKEPSRV
ncbi:unnamed protein product [Cochlearia groenlandica]